MIKPFHWMYRLTLLCFGLLTASIALAQPQAQTAGKCSPALSGSTVGNLDIKCGDRNPHREKLASAMVVLNRDIESAINGKGTELGGAFTALYDTSDPAFETERGAAQIYFFLAAESGAADEYIPGGHECEFQKGYSVLGAAVRGGGGERVELVARLLSKSSPVLRAVCQGLGLRASGQPDRSDETALTNFDMIAAESLDFAVIILMPDQLFGQSFEERSARAYWSGLISNNDPASLGRQLIQQLGRRGLESVVSELRTKGQATLTVQAGPNNAWGPLHPVPPLALEAFGPDVQQMDKKWSSFLESARVKVGSEAKSLVSNGDYARLLPRNTVRDLGGDRFWNELAYGSDYAQSMNCLATIFIVDNDYGSVADLPSYRRCAAVALKVQREK